MKNKIKIPRAIRDKVLSKLRFGPINIKTKGPVKTTDAYMHSLAIATSTCRNITTFKMTSRIGDVSIYQLLP